MCSLPQKMLCQKSLDVLYLNLVAQALVVIQYQQKRPSVSCYFGNGSKTGTSGTQDVDEEHMKLMRLKCDAE